MTAKELYRAKGRFTEDISMLARFMPEVDFELLDFDENKTIRLKIYLDTVINLSDSVHDQEGWYLAAVYFGIKPFMIIQLAGLQLEGHKRRFITDWTAYGQAVQFLHLLNGEMDELINPDEDIPQLTEFWGVTLSDLQAKETELAHKRAQVAEEYRRSHQKEEN